MHTYQSKSGVIFNFNSDLSGEVIVTNTMREETRVPFAALAEFVDNHRKLRGGVRKPAKDETAMEERRRELPRAKERVSELIDAVRARCEMDEGLTPFDRQMFDVALNSVKGAR